METHIESLNPSEEEFEQLHFILENARDREPWKQAGTIWKNDKAYFTYLRGAYRKLWSRYPVRVEFKNNARYKQDVLDDDGNPVYYKTGKKAGEVRDRWVLDCEMCKDTFPQGEIQIDHINPTGSCKNNLEGAVFFYKLLCDAEDMRAVCIPCHEEITYAEKHGLTLEQAAREKSAIAWLDENTPAQQKEQLLEVGFNSKQISNATKRRKCYTQYLEELTGGEQDGVITEN